MKKFTAIAASAVLAVSMLGFAACGNTDGGNEGVINGNYTEPTAEELDTALDFIDTDKAFGDRKTDTGFEVLSKLSMGFTSNAMTIDLNTDIGYKLIMGENKLLGGGAASVKMNSKVGETETSGDYAATVYNDADWAYAEITGIADTPLKAKINFDKLLNPAPDLPGKEPGQEQTAPMAEEKLPVPAFDANTLIQTCKTYKIGLGLDASDGLKIKASVTEDTVWAFLSEAEVSEESITEIKKMISFNSFKLDAYLAFNKDGLFSQASLDMNIEIKVDGDKVAEILKDVISEIPGFSASMISGEMTYKLSGYFTVKAYGGAVTLPESIATDVTYLDMTDLLGGIMG